MGKPKAKRMEKWGFGMEEQAIVGVKGKGEGTKRNSLVRGNYSPGVGQALAESRRSVWNPLWGWIGS